MLRRLTMLFIASVLVGLVASSGIAALVSSSPGPILQEESADKKKQDEEKPQSETEDEPAEEEEEVDPAVAAYEELDKAHQKARREFIKEVRSASGDERMKLIMSGGPSKEFAQKFMDYAKEYAGSENEFKAIRFAATNGDDDIVSAAMEIMADKFADDKQLVTFLASFGRAVQFPNQTHIDFLELLISKSSEEAVKGASLYAKFSLFKSVPMMKESLAERADLADVVPAATQKFLKEMETGEKFNAMLEEMLGEVAEKYGDVKFGRSTLGKLAGDELYVTKYLTVGKVAPDIEGVDLDGEEFKLSDYRGKVVLLDFWGDW